MTDLAADDTRSFELGVELDAPADAVWHALTDPVELVRWFPLTARVKPGLGGSIFLSWGPGFEGEAPITAWDPPQRLRWTEHLSMDGGKTPPQPVHVDFELTPADDRTLLHLVQSGMGRSGDWDGYYDSIARGWRFELRGLKHYLTRHFGRERRVVWVRQKTRFAAEEAAARTLGDAASVLHGPLRSLSEGDRYGLAPVTPFGTGVFGRVVVHDWPRSFAGTAENLNDAFFRFELERTADLPEVWLWLSAYGVDSDTLRGIESQWTDALRRVHEDRFAKD